MTQEIDLPRRAEHYADYIVNVQGTHRGYYMSKGTKLKEEYQLILSKE